MFNEKWIWNLNLNSVVVVCACAWRSHKEGTLFVVVCWSLSLFSTESRRPAKMHYRLSSSVGNLRRSRIRKIDRIHIKKQRVKHCTNLRFRIFFFLWVQICLWSVAEGRSFVRTDTRDLEFTYCGSVGWKNILTNQGICLLIIYPIKSLKRQQISKIQQLRCCENDGMRRKLWRN